MELFLRDRTFEGERNRISPRPDWRAMLAIDDDFYAALAKVREKGQTPFMDRFQPGSDLIVSFWEVELLISDLQRLVSRSDLTVGEISMMAKVAEITAKCDDESLELYFCAD